MTPADWPWFKGVPKAIGDKALHHCQHQQAENVPYVNGYFIVSSVAKNPHLLRFLNVEMLRIEPQVIPLPQSSS